MKIYLRLLLIIMLVKIPVLPLKDLVLFPGANIPILVGREKSIKAIQIAKNSNNKLVAVAQKDFNLDLLTEEDLYKFGVIIEIKEIVESIDKNYKILIQALNIVKIEKLYFEDSIYADVNNKINYINESDENKIFILKKNIIKSFEQYLKIQKKSPTELLNKLYEIQDIFEVIYLILNNLQIKIESKQKILECFNSEKAAQLLIFEIESKISMLNIEKKLKIRIKTQVEEAQRQYYLNEQIKAIKEELGDNEDDSKQDDKYYEKLIEKVKLTLHAKTTALAEVKKLKNLHPISAEAGIIKNYLDFLLELPWNKFTKMKTNIEDILKTLNNHQFGMEEVKQRICELIIQKKRVKNLNKPPVLCFVGPPGVGKTSLAFAIGEAIGYKTMVIPLGGMKDESILKGHKKTYIGAMPGKIIQSIKDAQTNNLILVLEEIGSIGQDWKSSPEDVLLELLDNVQNKNFQDHYLATGYDLSGIIFIATANYLNSLKPAIIDRLEIIKISGYTLEEKKQIAKKYLLPKILKEHAIDSKFFILEDEILEKIISLYTYESGVRELERILSKLARKVMFIFEQENKEFEIKINNDFILKYLKFPKYDKDYEDNEPKIGVINGLAYVGTREGQEGEILKIEGTLTPGKGLIECTGSLGDVMKESVKIAFKTVLSFSKKYNINLDILKENDVFIHFPSGAVPKDGPSAGVAIACVIFSCLKNLPIPNNFAVTGEIGLHNVLKIGGLKEKILAAYKNSNIQKVFIPYQNISDLEEIPSYVKEKIKIIPIKNLEEILNDIFKL